MKTLQVGDIVRVLPNPYSSAGRRGQVGEIVEIKRMLPFELSSGVKCDSFIWVQFDDGRRADLWPVDVELVFTYPREHLYGRKLQF